MIIKVTIGSKPSDNGYISEREEYFELESFEDFTKEYLISQLFVTRDIWIEKSKNFGSHSESIEKLYDDVFSKEVDIVRSVQDWPTEKSKEILQFHGDEIHCFEESGNYHSLKWVDIELIRPRFCYKPKF